MEMVIYNQVVEVSFENKEEKTLEDVKPLFLNENTDVVFLEVQIDKKGKWEWDILSLENSVVYEFFGFPLMVLKEGVGLEILREAIEFFNKHLEDKGKGYILILPHYISALKVKVYFKILEKNKVKIFRYPAKIKRKIPYSFREVENV